MSDYIMSVEEPTLSRLHHESGGACARDLLRKSRALWPPRFARRPRPPDYIMSLEGLARAICFANHVLCGLLAALVAHALQTTS